MIIVANTFLLSIFKNISIFKVELGDNLISMNDDVVQIKDPFMLKYLNMTSKQVLTYGSIGKLKFYQDFTLPSKEFYIFNDESIYGLVYSEEDSKMVPEKYLATVIQEINEKEGIKESNDKIEKKDPDIKLPAEQYIQEMIKKRKMKNG